MRRLPLRSPPRVRGKERLLPEKHTSSGITPAYAGKSVKVNEPDCLPRDHPRVCGEKTSSNVPERKNPGSPPRMQGKGCPLLFRYYFIGITPACAGKRDKAGLPFVPVRDHPRVCGEKSGRVRPWRKHKGSPPRVRGKVGAVVCGVVYSGITPAYAGKSTLYSGIRRVVLGSPPRMRGKEEDEHAKR